MFTAIKNLLSRIFGRYEAGIQWQKQRTYLPGFVQDPRFDADQATRMELVRKSRYFEKNGGIGQALGEKFIEFTVGPYGPQMIPASSDEEWNQRASDWLGEWTHFADLTSRLGYAGIMTTAACRRFFDGEFFILKTRGETGRPRLQGISAHRVATPMSMMADEGTRIFDGVQVDSRGRPEGYWIQENIVDDAFTFRSVNEVIHLFEPESPGQYRGLPMLTPVLNYLHDWDDLFMFEMAAAKDAAAITNVVENATGTIDPSQLTRMRYSQSNQKSDATATTENRTQFFKQLLGSRTVALKQGEKLSQMKSERPSVTTQWFFDYVASLICSGVGISKLLVFPWSIQGTVARAELDLASTYFRSRFVPFQSATREIYIYTMGTARFLDTRVADAPADWMRVSIRPPRAPNVDIGRNSAATIADLDAGVTTYDEVYGARGLDWREQFRQRGREEQFIDKLAGEMGLTPDRIRKAISESLKLEMEKTAERQAKEDLITA